MRCIEIIYIGCGGERDAGLIETWDVLKYTKGFYTGDKISD